MIKNDNHILTLSRDPLQLLEGYIGEGYAAAGYIGYEYSEFTETGFSRSTPKTGTKYPDLYFLLYRMDEIESGDISELTGPWKPASSGGQEPLADDAVSANMSQTDYIEMVEKAKKYIENGDIYQVNLSQRFSVERDIDPLAFFRRLFHVQHVPFGSYMDFGNFQLVSGSMELFLRRKGRKLITQPIKGTRRRGYSREMDIIKKAELAGNEKERAENLMIVDLMRNDLSRICRSGSVRVNRLFDVESYSTLHQMVSEVEGELREGMGIADIIRNVFPPGSVTGAPKRRALEIIDELEPHLRGPYCGAVGIFYPDGDFTLSVGIRTSVIERGSITFWTGGGIVWDSGPEAEYAETLLKSVAVRKALGISE